jgi:hypothetical protein
MINSGEEQTCLVETNYMGIHPRQATSGLIRHDIPLLVLKSKGYYNVEVNLPLNLPWANLLQPITLYPVSLG